MGFGTCSVRVNVTLCFDAFGCSGVKFVGSILAGGRRKYCTSVRGLWSIYGTMYVPH
jgi:hypothetical protein